MLLSFKRSDKSSVLLNDLINIHNDRISCYEQALTHSKELESDLKILFKEIIGEAKQMKDELAGKIVSPAGSKLPALNITGRIYGAWMDLKVTITGKSTNAIVTFCSYHEEIAQHAYKAALNASTDISKDVETLITQQHAALKRTSELVKKNREAYSYLHAGLMYFN